MEGGQWRQRLGNFGDGLTQRGRYPGGRKSPSGAEGRRPNRGSSGRSPEADIILEMDVKLIFYGGKIENAYTDIQLTIRIGGMVI